MALAATLFLGLLDEAQRRSAHHDLASPERRSWTNAPVRGKAGGIALGDLDGVQLRAFSDLLAALLSAKGYGKVRDVMLGDVLRAIVDGEPNEGVGIEAFRFAVFGDPSATSRWAVQFLTMEQISPSALYLIYTGVQNTKEPWIVVAVPHKARVPQS